MLLDLGLPNTDGLAFCQRLRRHQLHQPLVLMLTARDGSAIKVAGFESLLMTTSSNHLIQWCCAGGFRPCCAGPIATSWPS